MLNSIVTWIRHRDAIRDLSRLTNRQLADIGIARSEIEAVVARATDDRRAEGSFSAEWLGRMASSWAHHNRRSQAA